MRREGKGTVIEEAVPENVSADNGGDNQDSGKPPVLKSILLRNFLSFGPDTAPLQLRPLNVLIGPNGSGKSNLIEAISLLRNAPQDLTVPLQASGSIQDWLWRGAVGTPEAQIHVDLQWPLPDLALPAPVPLQYRLSFTAVKEKLRVAEERLYKLQVTNERLYDEELFWDYYRFNYEADTGVIDIGDGKHHDLRRKDVDTGKSVFSQRQDPHFYPELTAVGRLFEGFRLYRNWHFGPDAALRRPQPILMHDDYLDENTQNLGPVLAGLRGDPRVKRALLEHLKTVYEPADDIQVRRTDGGYAQIFLKERGYRLPASRLSDGTLRWLCLLVILLHPAPPPLVCIEEPELGLHPDMMPTLADLLRDASERMQLIVTTHSSALVDALTPTPEAVVVCEKDEEGTAFQRLDRNQLSGWLEEYGLGRLWNSGEIGGNRW
jgi:predicted ATPase